jgi:HD-like signal output (HDOD) protein
MPILDTYLQQIRTLPTEPRVLVQLLSLFRTNDPDAGKIVDLVAYDPALTTKLLCRCNSVALSLAGPVESVQEAVSHLGYNELYQLVVTLVNRSRVGPAGKSQGAVGENLWRHSAVTAFASRFLARSFGGDENAAFTAGLLHDISRILIHWAVVDDFPRITERIRDVGLSFSGAEREVPGLNYAELSGRILTHWNFSEKLVRAVWHHHEPLRAHPHEQLAAYVHLGDFMAHAMGIGDGTNSRPSVPSAEALNMLEITSSDMETLILDTGTALKTIGWILEE